jgi:hypothetical protein
MFFRPRETKQRKGAWPAFCGSVMCFSTDSWKALITKFMLSSMPTAKLYGSRWLANLLRREWVTWLVIIWLIAVEKPRGWSLERSDGSLYLEDQ